MIFSMPKADNGWVNVVEKLSNILESAVEIQDEDSYVECYSPERKKTYLELSSVQKQVIDLETKFEDYNDEIVSNKVNILFWLF